MLLRRVIEHVKTQNWTAVALDFVIVVTGVFIGIQVSNWNTDRQNRLLAMSYIDRLAADIEIERAVLGRASDYFGTARRHASSALDGFLKPAEDLDERFLIDLYQASQVWFVAFNHGTYDELQSTGRIVFIRDPALRTTLANHYVRITALDYTLKANSEYRRIARLNMHNEVQSAIRRDCGDRWVTETDSYYYVVLPAQCEIDLPSELARAEIAKLYGNEELQRELRFHLSVLDAQLGVLGNAAQIADATLAKIRKAAP